MDMTTPLNVCAVVPAAGFGRRMKLALPKQYLNIGCKTILEHSVATLLIHPYISRVVIAINPEDTHFASLPLACHPKITVVDGGLERVDSVLAGIQASGNAQWILVHDAVRPCLHYEDLTRLLSISSTSNIGGILATPVRDTIKRATRDKNNIVYTVERIDLWHALTPQFFPRELLYYCLTKAVQEGVIITDESSALEYFGFQPKLIEGRADNIKVTFMTDLQLARFYLAYSNI